LSSYIVGNAVENKTKGTLQCQQYWQYYLRDGHLGHVIDSASRVQVYFIIILY